MIMFFGFVIIVMLIGITKKTSTVVLIVIFAETAATKMIPLWIMLRVSALTAERLLQTKKECKQRREQKAKEWLAKAGKVVGVVTAVAGAAAYLASQISSDDSTEDDTDGVSLKKD